MSGRPLRSESLSEAAIVDAALRLAREQGLESVRMRDIAADLGVAVGAIYHHIPSQAALHIAVVHAAFADVPLPSQLRGSARQRIVKSVMAIQRTLDDNPGIRASVAAMAPQSELGVDMRACLREAGLTAKQADRAYVGIGWLWLGSRVTDGTFGYDAAAFRTMLDLLLDGLLGKEPTQ